ncbi:ABC transporter substrate-binding protein [Romboutsia sp.]|uniref:ABC transporter substrate-binding protein n=1 Tax=Romboutsia sp. TaxID=1965302 RepID=UPI003F329F61
MNKKLISVLTTSMLTFSMLAGCASTDEKKEDTAKKEEATLTFMTNKVGAPSDAIKQVCENFTKETGIKVEFSAPGNNYEELMKTKMAANDLPDLWTTHGWSVARYSEYLMPLNDQPWFKDVSQSIKPVITDENDKIYALPVNMDIAGILYNVDVLEKAGVKVDDIKTWGDFEKALQQIKDAGFIPIHIGGKDSWTIGQFFDWVAPSFYVTNESSNFRKELKDGSFDMSKWSEVAGLFEKWNNAGYFNVDSLTSDYMSATQLLGEGKVAFEFYGNYGMTDALTKNKDAKLGFMPIPAKDASDQPTLIAGEDIAIGVNKDTKNKEAALKLLNYFAKADVLSELSSVSKMPSGINGVDSDTGMAKTYYDKYKDVKTMPYFDRAFLPNGMWDDMCIGGASILAKEKDSVQKAVDQMTQSYKDKINQ